MKWIKRLVVFVVVLALLAGGSALVIHRLARSKPDWYPSRVLDKATLGLAARSVEDKLVGVQNWAQDNNANERNRQSGLRPGSPGYTPAPDPVKQILFTESELNAFFLEWDGSMHWKDHYSEYVDDPVLVLQDNRLILAGTVKSLDMVVSVHFEPSIDPEGKLRLSLVRVMGGSLTMPRAFWSGYLEKLSGAMRAKIEQSQEAAQIADDGSMNHEAVVVEMNRLLLHGLNNEPADPFLFLRHDNAHPHNAYPVRLTAVKIADKTINMTVIPLSPDERTSLLKRIKSPETEAGNKPETATNPPAGAVG